MASPIEDFIVSLGFDTSKIQKEISNINSMLSKVAVKTDKQREQSGLKVQKTLKDDAIKNHNLVEKALQKNQEKQLKREEDLYKLQLAKNKAIDDQNRKLKQSSSFIESAKRQQAVRALLYPEANPQLKAMGSYYKKLQSDQSALGIANQRLRSRRAVGTLTNLQAFRDLKESGPEGRKQALESLLAARMAAKGGKLDRIKTIRSEVIKLNRSLQETGKIVNTRPTNTGILGTINAITNAGGFKGYTEAQRDRLLAGAQKQDTQKGADAFIRVARDIERYRGIGGGKIDRAISSGNIDNLRTTYKELGRMNAELERTRRASIGAAAAMSSLHDSTRNMVREYASLYAMTAGTIYFKEQIKALDGMGASLASVSKNAEEAASTQKYLKQMIMSNGLSMKDTAKDFVKLRAAMMDKHSLKDTQDAFESLTVAGRVLQLDQHSMALAVKAVSQMFSKEGIRAEELTQQLGDHLPIAMRALQKSTGKTAKELYDMMQAGKLTGEYILPFTKALRELTDVNGAYAKSLDKLGAREDIMKTTFSILSSEGLDRGGFTVGLKNLYGTITKETEQNAKTFERLGAVYNKFFNGLAYVVELASKWFEVFLRSVESVYLAVKNNPFTTMLVSVTALVGAFKMMPALLRGVATALVSVLSKPLALLTAAMTVIDEIRAIYDPNVIGLMENDRASQEDRDIAAANYKIQSGYGTDADRKLLKGLSSDRIQQAMNSSAGLGAMFFNPATGGTASGDTLTNNPFTRLGTSIGQNMPSVQERGGSVILSVLEGIAKSSAELVKSAAIETAAMYNKNTIGGQIYITVNSPDPEKAGNSVAKELEKIAGMQSVGAR